MVVSQAVHETQGQIRQCPGPKKAEGISCCWSAQAEPYSPSTICWTMQTPKRQVISWIYSQHESCRLLDRLVQTHGKRMSKKEKRPEW